MPSQFTLLSELACCSCRDPYREAGGCVGPKPALGIAVSHKPALGSPPSATRSLARNPAPRNSRSAVTESKRQAICSAVHTGSSCRTSGKLARPWHRTCAPPESDSDGRRKHSLESRPHRWSRSTDPAAAPVLVGFPSPCHIDAQNVLEVTCFGEESDYYHGLLGVSPRAHPHHRDEPGAAVAFQHEHRGDGAFQDHAPAP